MHWTWIVWFTCGFISFLIIPEDQYDPKSKGWARFQHFLICFFLGGLSLGIAVSEIKERQRKEEEESRKEREKYLEKEARKKSDVEKRERNEDMEDPKKISDPFEERRKSGELLKEERRKWLEELNKKYKK